MQVKSTIELPYFPYSFPPNLMERQIPCTPLTLGKLLDANNSFAFSRENNRKQTILRVNLQDGSSWRIIRNQTILPQVNPQQPPCVKWTIEKGRHHRSTNVIIPIQIPEINRALQRVFAENKQYLI